MIVRLLRGMHDLLSNLLIDHRSFNLWGKLKDVFALSHGLSKADALMNRLVKHPNIAGELDVSAHHDLTGVDRSLAVAGMDDAQHLELGIGLGSQLANGLEQQGDTKHRKILRGHWCNHASA